MDTPSRSVQASVSSLRLEEFTPVGTSHDDERVRALASIVRRRGQSMFRSALLKAYAGKCAVTGCDAVDALEAAHISPYRGLHTHAVSNGLLLRADLHTLFDLGLLAIDSATLAIFLAPTLRATSYGDLHGRALVNLPQQENEQPDREALAIHYQEALVKFTGSLP